jgi:hypothetical protein
MSQALLRKALVSARGIVGAYRELYPRSGAADVLREVDAALDADEIELEELRAELAECQNAFDSDQRAIEDNKRLRAERDALVPLMQGWLADLKSGRLSHDWLMVSNVECYIEDAIDAARKP